MIDENKAPVKTGESPGYVTSRGFCGLTIPPGFCVTHDISRSEKDNESGLAGPGGSYRRRGLAQKGSATAGQ
jgi:hypothetical protein